LTSYDYLAAAITSRCRTERGASLVEYALLMALIAVVCVAGVSALGRETRSSFSSVSTGF